MAVLLILTIWAAAPLVFIAYSAGGRVFDGGDGMFGSVDQLQYMAWIRDGASHGLASSLFNIGPDPHVFLHPMFVFSAVLHRLGVSVQASYLAWEPVAIGAVFTGVVAYVRRFLGGGWASFAAAILALFFFTPVAPLVHWAGLEDPINRLANDIIAAELFSAGGLWGYLPTAIAFGLMPLCLLGVERLLEHAEGGTSRWLLAAVSTAGLMVSWLHPWQGLTLGAIILGLWVWARLDRRYMVLAPVLAAIAVPLAYYQLLGRISPAWEFAGAPRGYHHVGVWLWAIAPLVGLAGAGYLVRGAGVHERALRLWPVAALAVYFALNRSFFYHAFEGLSLPVGIMAVRALAHLPAARILTFLLVAVMTIPGIVFGTQAFLDAYRGGQDYLVASDDARALAYLSNSARPGAVIARYALGKDVPAFTGRQTWVGHPTWTPGWGQRVAQADAMFGGRLSAAETRRVITSSGALFVVSMCGDSPVFRDVARPLAVAQHNFGCAEVYELSSPQAAR